MAAEAPQFKPIEFPGVPERIDYWYSYGLSRQLRWVGAKTRSEKEESDLDHVRGMFDLLDEIVREHPLIVADMDLDAVRKMIYVHDGDELKHGDLVLSREDHAQIKDFWKARGEQDYHEFVDRFVRRKHPTLADEADHYYARYTHYDPNDKEAIFAHFIDKVQAVRFGSKYVYSSSGVRWGKSQEHSSLGLDNLQDFAVALSHLLDMDGRGDLHAFFSGEIDNFFDSLRDGVKKRWNLDR